MSIQINQSATLVNIISDNKLLLQRVVPYGINVFTEVLFARTGISGADGRRSLYTSETESCDFTQLKFRKSGE